MKLNFTIIIIRFYRVFFFFILLFVHVFAGFAGDNC